MANAKTNNIRVLCITRAYGNHAGGMERLSYEFINALSQEPGVHVTVIAHHGSRRSAPFFVCTALIRSLFAARNADIIHLGDPLLSFIGWTIQKIIGTPVAITVHGLDITYSNPLYQWYLRTFFRNFNLYLPISQAVADLLPRLTKKPTKIITPGIHDAYFDQSIARKQVSDVLAHPLGDRILLLTVGRVIERKGQYWFIDQVLPQLPPEVLYLIAGDGPDIPRIEALVAQKNLQNNVLLLKRVPAQTIKLLYNFIDAFVQPNILVPHDIEGFGLVLLEAALCERPVFAADIDGIPQAIQHNLNGTLVPAENAQAWIATLLTFTRNRSLYADLGKKARTYTLETFSWNIKVKEYLQVFSEIV